MVTAHRWARMMLLMGALAILAACGDDAEPSGSGPTPTPTAASTTFREPEWTIETPASWTREDITADADAKKAIRYRASSGEYVIVAIDPLGSDFGGDALWRYRAKTDRFEIAEKAPCTGETCTTTDTRYDGYVLWAANTEPPKLGGHTWYFLFGNTASTAAEEALFERIIESIRVTA